MRYKPYTVLYKWDEQIEGAIVVKVSDCAREIGGGWLRL